MRSVLLALGLVCVTAGAAPAQQVPQHVTALFCDTPEQVSDVAERLFVKKEDIKSAMQAVNEVAKKAVCGVLQVVLIEGSLTKSLSYGDKHFGIIAVAILGVADDSGRMITVNPPTANFGLKPLMQSSSFKAVDA